MENLIAKTKKLGWVQQPVSLGVEPSAEDKAKFLLIGKVLSHKVFSHSVVKEIIAKAWNTIKGVSVTVLDKNVFLFTFGHEVDVRKIWERHPWSFKGDHLILKKYKPEWSFNEVDFSVTDFWIQVFGLPLNRLNKANAQRIGNIAGTFLEEDLSGGGIDGSFQFIRIRVGLEVNRPLPTGFLLDYEELPMMWIPFKFEKLGNFCYGCGLLGHEVKDCPDLEAQYLWKEGFSMGIHGNWLRAKSKEFQPGIDLTKLRNADLAECGIHRPTSQNTTAEVAWKSMIQLAIDAWEEHQKGELMDESEQCVDANTGE